MQESLIVIIQTLLSKGMIKVESEVDLSRINRHLSPIGYDVVEFPHKRILVLKDRSESTWIQPPWKEKTIEEAKKVFVKLSQCTYLDEQSAVVDMLTEFNYLKREDGRLKFTERALVQFSDFIEGLDGRFKKCKLCGFLGDEGEFHNACKDFMGSQHIS
ncbi:uncharacterized protein VICG_01871 [Vittaforma corneae ATCC 50505]|uniref:Uncharacterized protein n=1 Tax=Vittaforma corneae (strain ATCC 50505) TaxID=993615 RepID=L2GJN2_VITCO|nr:uncharacterized protein VICG_01871 [Vittaforma corneae ATCC 50505]ELA41078.1 hypothetical protein VICG_01871 [Vittaforma corneae ATCC 50505]